jgi:hypothetical protein
MRYNASMRRRVAAIMLVLLTGGLAAPVTCTGWEASAAGRMTCCQRAQHEDCIDQSAADDCCAQAEQSRQVIATASPSLPATIHTSLAALPDHFDYTTALDLASPLVSHLRASLAPSPPALLLPLRI